MNIIFLSEYQIRPSLHKVANSLCANPVNTKYLYNICTILDQRLRRWSNIVQMLYKYFVFTGKFIPDRQGKNRLTINNYCQHRVAAALRVRPISHF